MKSRISLLISCLALVVATIACNPSSEEHSAHDHDHDGHQHGDAHDHGHDHGNDGDHDHPLKEKGPHGGRLVVTDTVRYEIVILEDRHIEFRLMDQANQVIPHSQVSVEATSGDRTSPVTILFSEVDPNVLKSTQPLPEGQSLPTIITVSQKASKDTMHVEKFNANMITCPDCSLKEYACICGHTDGHHH